MEAAIRLLNEMVTRGLLDSYAIGGAMASLDEILERHGLRGRWDQWTKGSHV
jgi:hypothetical protein